MTQDYYTPVNMMKYIMSRQQRKRQAWHFTKWFGDFLL